MALYVSQIRRTGLTLAVSAAVFVAGLTLVAQTPPAGQAPAPAPAPGAPPAGGPAGRGAPPVRRGLVGAMPTNPYDFEFSPKPAITAKSPADEQKSFVLPPGYRMELVLAEPDVINPSVIEFDGNGRMYVCEFVTYMPDADGNHQHDPVSRITRF